MADRKWYKTRANIAIDDWFRSGDVRENLLYARDRLINEPGFAELVNRLGADKRTKDEFRYPREGALRGHDFEKVTRQGYLEAIGLALSHTPAVPITTFWMTGAGNANFEMHITDEAEQVFVTMLVPEVEGGSTAEKSPESWVVTRGTAEQPMTKQTSGPSGRRQPSRRPTSG